MHSSAKLSSRNTMVQEEAAAASPSAMPSLTYDYYPAYAHSAHPLHNTWFKLPATVFQSLHVPPGFDSSITSPTGFTLPLYHLLNHPVPFADVCGLVVGCNLKENLGIWSILVDDGSGEVLEVLCRKAREEEDDFWRFGGKDRASGGKARVAGPGELIVPPVPEWKGRGWIGAEVVDMRQVQVGRVLRVKGRPREWRATKQLLVERICEYHSALPFNCPRRFPPGAGGLTLTSFHGSPNPYYGWRSTVLAVNVRHL